MPKVTKPETLTLTFDADKISSDKFVKAFEAFFGIVKEVCYEISGSKSKIETFVQIEKGSVVLRAELIPKNPKDAPLFIHAKRKIYEGMDALENNVDKRPEFFNRQALEYSKVISTLRLTKRHPFTTMKISLNGKTKPVSREITTQTLATVDKLIGDKFIAVGAVEGVVRTISDYSGNLKFYLYDEQDDVNVLCNVSNEKEKDVLDKFRQRVVANGIVHYNKDGFPNAIDVEEITSLPTWEKLPPVEKFIGILK